MPWRLGPPDGRYLLRDSGDSSRPPSHILVLVTLGAPERRRLGRRRPQAAAAPPPAAVTTTRATVIDTGTSAGSDADAQAWLRAAGEEELRASLEVLNRVLHAYRLVTADPYIHPVGRAQAIAARLGYGIGEQVAEGQWTRAREHAAREPRRGRTRVLHPQARLAAVLGAREPLLACEELALRARLDLDHGRDREAALQVVVALDAALAELPGDPAAAAMAPRLAELRELRDAVGAAGQSALSGALSPAEHDTVSRAAARIEAALRARAVENA